MTHEPPNLTERFRYGFLVLATAVTCGYGFFYAYYVSRVTRGFPGKTDVIGYPAFNNYNNQALYYGYLLGLTAGIAALAVLVRYVNLRQMEEFLPRLQSVVLMSALIALALTLKSNGTWYGWAIVSFVLLALVEIGAARIDSWRSMSGKASYVGIAFSITLAATVPLLLFHISQNTGWRTAPGNITHLRWFPAPVLILAELAVLGLAIASLRRKEGRCFFERHFVRFILLPSLIYVLTANLPAATVVNDFHGGEKLAPLALGLRGELPWRDFLFIHGVWDDFLQLYVPARLWEATPRTGLAGTPLLFAPVYWVCFYLCFLVVFDFSLLPALTALFVLVSLIFPDPFRFLLYPLILLCLYKAFQSRRTVLWIALIALCGLQVLLAPEFALLALVLGLVVIFRDVLERDRSRQLTEQFRPTLICAISSVAFVALAGWWLASRGFLGGFLITAVQIARGHLETGGTPVQSYPGMTWTTAIPLLSMAGTALVFAQALRQTRSRVSPRTWLLVGLAACTAVYYTKYIGRPDIHIGEVIAVAQPGIALLVIILFEEASDSLRARSRAWPSSAAMICLLGLILVFGFPGYPFQASRPLQLFLNGAASLRSRFIAANDVTDFAALDTDDTTNLRAAALRQFFAAHLHPGDAVFDFSDSPTTFYVILGLKPASRFIHVSMAIQEDVQREVVSDLEKSRPPYVIYYSDGGLNGWDNIPNQVRHYVIGRYLNLHYTYDRTIEGSVIFRRTDLPSELPDDGGSVAIAACDLGYTPGAFAPRVAPSQMESAAVSRPTAISYLLVIGWTAVTSDRDRPELLVNWNGAILDRFRPGFFRHEIDKPGGQPLAAWGFYRRIVLPNTSIAAKEIDITAGNLAAGKFAHLGDGNLRGGLDSKSVGVMQTVSLSPPRANRPAYLALQFADAPAGEPQQFLITSPQSEEAGITFTKKAGDRELLLPLGGCYAWGPISSGPRIGSAKPFTLKSASYYYE